MTASDAVTPPDRSEAEAPDVSRLVVLAPNWLGDAVMALPALLAIRRHFAGGRLTVAARGRLGTLFETAAGVDEVLTLAVGRGSGRSNRRLLEAGAFDLAILLPNSFGTAWMAHRARIPQRWGYRGDGRAALLTRSVPRPRGRLHQGAYYQHLLQALGMATGPLTPQLLVPDRDRERGRQLLLEAGWDPAAVSPPASPESSKPLVAMAPGAAYGFAKRWPPQYFGRLAARLSQAGIGCLLDGVPEDRATGRDVLAAYEAAGGRADSMLNLIGRTSLHDLMGLLTHCSSFVGNDSGAGHLAAAVGLPVVMIFGPTDVRTGAPLPAPAFEGEHAALSHPVFCSPCWLRECVIDHRCMTRIEADQVFEAVMKQVQARVHG